MNELNIERELHRAKVKVVLTVMLFALLLISIDYFFPDSFAGVYEGVFSNIVALLGCSIIIVVILMINWFRRLIMKGTHRDP